MYAIKVSLQAFCRLYFTFNLVLHIQIWICCSTLSPHSHL